MNKVVMFPRELIVFAIPLCRSVHVRLIHFQFLTLCNQFLDVAPREKTHHASGTENSQKDIAGTCTEDAHGPRPLMFFL